MRAERQYIVKFGRPLAIHFPAPEVVNEAAKRMANLDDIAETARLPSGDIFVCFQRVHLETAVFTCYAISCLIGAVAYGYFRSNK